MATADTSPIPPDSPFAASSLANAMEPGRDRWERWTVWLEKASNRLNPILIKEARQALKSRQFSLTFALLLLCGWLWSVFRVTTGAPAIYFAPAGADLLFGYFLILVVPMFVIIPFSAFRSLAIEREDGTFELLSITTLSARQIVTGKLGSAVLQMIVYYSAISPCIAFTYLLRGIDIPTILFVLVWTFLLSIGLAILGLLFATITRARHWQSVLSVLVILGLLLAGGTWCVVIGEMLFWGGAVAFDDSDFLTAMAGLLTALVSFSVLFVLAAASRISFASDNSSTRLRITMLVQQVLFIGWLVVIALLEVGSDEVAYVFVSLAGIYWAIAGAIMTGESSKLAPRVQRELPRSLAGRMLLTWFYPGSGTGYFFAIGNLLALVLVSNTVFCALFFLRTGSTRLGSDFAWFWFSIMVWAYVAMYLGAGRLLYLLARRANPESLLLAFLIQFFLAMGGAAAPWALQSWLSDFQSPDYTPLQFTNWAWTLAEMSRGGSFVGIGGIPFINYEVSISCYLVLIFTTLIVILNLFFTVEEVDRGRIEAPPRIAEDELALHPELKPVPKRLSPWDE